MDDRRVICTKREEPACAANASHCKWRLDIFFDSARFVARVFKEATSTGRGDARISGRASAEYPSRRGLANDSGFATAATLDRAQAAPEIVDTYLVQAEADFGHPRVNPPET